MRHDPTAAIIVNKELAARGQLHTAIALWFSYGDPVSIHTLAAAAQGIRLMTDDSKCQGELQGAFPPQRCGLISINVNGRQRESIRDKTSLDALTRLVCKAEMRLQLASDFLTIPAP